MNATVFIEPLDVLFFRGNKLFGEPGSYGAALMPPWPSVFAGALRSRMLVDAGIDPAAFASKKVRHDQLGTPDEPGAFAVTDVYLAQRFLDGRCEIIVPPPADLVITEENKQPVVNAMRPVVPADGLSSFTPFQRLAILPENKRGKPEDGYWLSEAGWRKYLVGQIPSGQELLESKALWKYDYRVGIGLNENTRSVSEGRLFSLQAVAPIKRGYPVGSQIADYDVGFLVGVCGATPPGDGMIRLGGDGRAAALHPAQVEIPEPDYETIVRMRRCRLILTTPGIFENGWLPPGCTKLKDGGFRFELGSIKANIICAAVPRFGVVSGWDLAKNVPKPAFRAVPAGAVYWLDDLEATPGALKALVERGLWGEADQSIVNYQLRRAEGFNRFTIAIWK